MSKAKLVCGKPAVSVGGGNGQGGRLALLFKRESAAFTFKIGSGQAGTILNDGNLKECILHRLHRRRRKNMDETRVPEFTGLSCAFTAARVSGKIE